MPKIFDFIVIGVGSAVATRLSKDLACRVALLEEGGRPPAEEQIPVLYGTSS